jgi:hypothetical protein
MGTNVLFKKPKTKNEEKQLYRCSVACEEFECKCFGPHELTESCNKIKCGLYPSAKCKPYYGDGKIVLKTDKKKKVP